MGMTAAQFIEIKTRADKEWNRRKYYGSMTSYAGKAYSPETPAAGKPMYAAQGNLVMTPFTKMKTHGNLATSSAGTLLQSSFDYATIKGWLSTLESRTATSSVNDCNASCSGMCVSQCSTGCTGCTGCSGCSGTCSGTCTGCSGTCSGGCTGCSGTCSGSCSGCSGTCKGSCSGCSGTCKGSCSGCSGCSGTCSGGCSSCSGTCSGSCSGCSGSCSGSCTGCSGCSGTCSGCSGSCSGCRGCTGCGSDCTGGCSASCKGGGNSSCKSGCGGCNSCSGCAGCSGCRGASISIPPAPRFEILYGEKGEAIVMKTYTLPNSQEMNDYLQRLDYDINTRLLVIDKMFTMHKDDTDTSLFDSIIWKKYYKELEEVKAEYEIAKLKLQGQLAEAVDEIEGRQGVQFNWSIDDFLIPVVTITVLDGE